MLISSLLPKPKNQVKDNQYSSNKHKNPAHIDNENIIKQLTQDSGDNTLGTSSSEDIFDITIRKGVKFSDFIPLRQNDFTLKIPMPTEQEIDDTFQRTKRAFEKILSKKTEGKSSVPLSSEQANKNSYELEYSNRSSEGNNNSRVVKIVQHAADPLQPNTIKAKKVVAPSTEDNETPIFHKSDVGKDDKNVLSKEEKEKWNIPSAISSWKNPNGYTISLDKRLAFDARYNKDNLQSNDINEKFVELSNALEDADRAAREELKERTALKKKQAEELIKQKEANLKLLAEKAREHEENKKRSRYEGSTQNKEETEAERVRALIRKAKTQEVEKDVRKAKMSTSDRLRKLAHSQGRDVSEKIILEAAKATTMGHVSYDSRLMSKGANAHSKRSEDQVYDNPLFVEQDISRIYRPNVSKLDEKIVDENALEVLSMNSKLEPSSTSTGPIEFTEADTDDSKKNASVKFGIQDKKKE